jgi:hypothetical protein
MAHAYAPGLTVSDSTLYRKERRLPLKGTVVVGTGDRVGATQVVARTDLPGAVFPENVARRLAIPEREVPAAMLVETGSRVERGQVIARASSFFGMFTKHATSPTAGTIESVSRVTGQVMIRALPTPVELDAFVDGRVVDVFENEGVVIETQATFVQGIFGVGGEAHGEILMRAGTPDDALDAPEIGPDCRGKIVVGGSLVTIGAVRRALEEKAAGIIAGGINDADLREFLGYDLGVAITGSEDRGLTLVVTEGFGKIRMADRTFVLLKSHQGRAASICGATQIRAGVMRPEIVVPLAAAEATRRSTREAGAMEIGSVLRLIREPYFGEIARVVSLPRELTTVETEARVRVVEVELATKERVVLPRANVELIEEF